MRDYLFIGGEVRDVLDDHESHPDTISEGVRIENTMHNCYKAVEAIHGGNLPHDDGKVVRKFAQQGIDLSTPVGYSRGPLKREPAIDKLVRLRRIRDYKAAHGRITRDRKSSFYELMDHQRLVRFIVAKAIEARCGISID